MRIFVAGASGAVGGQLVPLLVAGGHQVIATTRTPEKRERLRAQGSEPVVVDGLDGDAVRQAVVAAHPDAIVHEMTAIASLLDLKRLDDELALTNRLRTEGTRHLLAAARAAGTPKLVAQSYTGWPNERRGGRVKTEDDPLDPDPPPAMRRSLAAIRALEELVTTAPGIAGTVLRYGSLYGPGTSIAARGEIVEMLRRRRFPLLGGGAGVWSFLHVEDAARATRLALERHAPGLYNVVDDEPAEVRDWLPYLARAVGARPPIRLPAWIGRLAVGEAGLSMMTRIRGSSNEKVKRDLGWQPQYVTWREGFARGLGE
jgi:nucleoside-diphosphate-sugar epimerase